MLAVDLQTLVTPGPHDAADQRLGVLDRPGRGRTQIEAVPPTDVLNRAILVEQQQLRVIVQQIRAWIDSQRAKVRPQGALDCNQAIMSRRRAEALRTASSRPGSLKTTTAFRPAPRTGSVSTICWTVKLRS
jgi:hypothetical protein